MGGVSVKGRETYFKDLVAGANTITLYGAYAGWAGTNKSSPDMRDIGLAFCYVDGSGNWQSASSLGDGALTADASAWINDTGLTAFKIAITVTTNAAQTVPVNMVISPEYDTNGIIYVDPNIVVS